MNDIAMATGVNLYLTIFFVINSPALAALSCPADTVFPDDPLEPEPGETPAGKAIMVPAVAVETPMYTGWL